MAENPPPGFKDILKGHLSRHAITRYYVPITIASFVMLLVIACVLFPYQAYYPYQWFTSTISRLGWPHENPVGWIFFSAAFIVLGALGIPIGMYYYDRFRKISKYRALMMVTSLIVASIGEIMIGAIPNFKEPTKVFLRFHSIDAILAFFGSYMMGVCMAILMLGVPKLSQSVKIPVKLIACYFSALIAGLTCTVMMIVVRPSGDVEQFVFDPSKPFWLQVPFWEWFSFMITLFLLLAPAFVFPEMHG